MRMNTKTLKVKLTVKPTHFVGAEADVEREPEGRSLVVSLVVLQKALAWAGTKGFVAPRLFSNTQQTAAFARALKAAMGDPARPGRMTSAGQIRAFFDDPANLKVAQRILGLLELGGVLEVDDA